MESHQGRRCLPRLLRGGIHMTPIERLRGLAVGRRHVYAHTRETFIVAFNARLTAGHGGCIEWNGVRNEQGYGRFHAPHFLGASKSVAAHRLAWQLFRGPIPDGMYVCHSCNNKPCCNPDHLYLATHRQNVIDAGRDNLLGNKGSGVCKKGHFHGLVRGRCPVCAKMKTTRYLESHRDEVRARGRAYWHEKQRRLRDALAALSAEGTGGGA